MMFIIEEQMLNGSYRQSKCNIACKIDVTSTNVFETITALERNFDS